MRIPMRRFTRLTNAFSKKLENHIAAIGLHFMHYNFARTHQTLRMTPTIAVEVVNAPMEIENIVKLLEDFSQESLDDKMGWIGKAKSANVGQTDAQADSLAEEG